jgi:hypothetical protein
MWVFELFTLGTLAALAVLGIVGYLAAKPLRVEVRRSEQNPLVDEASVLVAE